MDLNDTNTLISSNEISSIIIVWKNNMILIDYWVCKYKSRLLGSSIGPMETKLSKCYPYIKSILPNFFACLCWFAVFIQIKPSYVYKKSTFWWMMTKTKTILVNIRWMNKRHWNGKKRGLLFNPDVIRRVWWREIVEQSQTINYLTMNEFGLVWPILSPATIFYTHQ